MILRSKMILNQELVALDIEFITNMVQIIVLY